MSEDEFTKLFKYMQKEFKSIHDNFDQTANKLELNRLTDTIDAFAKQSEASASIQEMLALQTGVKLIA